MKKTRVNITLDSDAERKLRAFAKRKRISLSRLLQDGGISILLVSNAPEIKKEEQEKWIDLIRAKI